MAAASSLNVKVGFPSAHDVAQRDLLAGSDAVLGHLGNQSVGCDHVVEKLFPDDSGQAQARIVLGRRGNVERLRRNGEDLHFLRRRLGMRGIDRSLVSIRNGPLKLTEESQYL